MLQTLIKQLTEHYYKYLLYYSTYIVKLTCRIMAQFCSDVKC